MTDGFSCCSLNLLLGLSNPKVREMILEQGSSAEFGARLYRRQVERLIEDPLSDAILAASVKENFQAVGHPTPDGKAVIFEIVP